MIREILVLPTDHMMDILSNYRTNQNWSTVSSHGSQKEPLPIFQTFFEPISQLTQTKPTQVGQKQNVFYLLSLNSNKMSLRGT